MWECANLKTQKEQSSRELIFTNQFVEVLNEADDDNHNRSRESQQEHPRKRINRKCSELMHSNNLGQTP